MALRNVGRSGSGTQGSRKLSKATLAAYEEYSFEDMIRKFENARTWAMELNRQVREEYKLRTRAEDALKSIAEIYKLAPISAVKPGHRPNNDQSALENIRSIVYIAIRGMTVTIESKGELK